MNEFSPPIQLSTCELANLSAQIHIVREDLLPGGTKQRAIVPFLKELAETGIEEFVYASPFCGFAQVALAYGGAFVGKKVRLYCELASDQRFHQLSLLAKEMGAEIVACESLANAEEKAQVYALTDPSISKLPLGFNHYRFLHHYSSALEAQFDILRKKLGGCPDVLWLPVGSGTLSKIFRDVLPDKVHLKCVDVRVLNENDPRLQNVVNLKNTEVFRSDLRFHEESSELPPVPSNVFYDAKLWKFLNDHARNGDVWWNVAR